MHVHENRESNRKGKHKWLQSHAQFYSLYLSIPVISIIFHDFSYPATTRNLAYADSGSATCLGFVELTRLF